MQKARFEKQGGSVHAAIALSLVLSAACGGSGGGGGGGGGTSQATAPGTTAPSTTTATAPGGGGLDIGTQFAPGGALFFQDAPLRGEASVTGLVTVAPGGAQGGPPPADTVVTLNGVPLVHAAIAGASSPSLFTVDPTGPQPTIGADGFLHITASSASASARRVLNLACPFAIAVSPSPAAGSSLASVAQVQLAWGAGALPVQGRDFSAFGLTPPAVSLLGFDGATDTATDLGASFRPLAADAAGATVALTPTSTTGYLVELRYPGVYFIDGQTGGACGRTRRFAYSK